MSKKFDYIFAGFGLSGMTLFYELSKDADFIEKRVLIIDKDQKIENDRTWSFWSKNSNDFLHLARKSWQKGVFYGPGQQKIELDLKKYTYHTIEGKDFYRFIREHLSKFKNVTFLISSIEGVKNEGIVVTKEEEYEGEVVFRSYFDKSDFQPKMAKYFLWQHFFGFVIKTKESRFNSSEFTLMDYRFSDEKKTNFFYILPYQNNCALVEFTEFSNQLYSQDAYKEKLVDYIENKLNIKDYEITQREYNAIPMTDYQLDMVVSKHVLNIGSTAGYVKPSSGYAFTRTIERNKELAEFILSNRNLESIDIQSSKIYKAFDNAILYLIQHEKVHGGVIFTSLFEKLNTDFVFEFLDEKISNFELLKIMLASPKKLEFIKYFLKQ